MPDVRRVTLCSATLGEDGMCEPPLGPLYIAAAFEECGVEVDFRDFQLDPDGHGLSGDRLAEFLSGHADVVAISCFVDMLPAVVEATQQLHRARPDSVFLLGGPGPTAAARRLLERYPWLTAVVRGEGEEPLREWVSMMRGQLSGPIAGMVYRDGEVLLDGPDRPRIRALDDLPLPAYHLIDWRAYSHARIVTTRGCAYRCSFCDVTALWGNRSVYRGLPATVAEIELLRDRYGKSAISIVDDTFVLNRKRVREFCRLLIERQVGVAWGCFGRINLMTPDLIELMAEAGCTGIFYGIDSGSQRVLDRTVKKVKAEDVMPVLRSSAQHFDRIEASFIWGYPFETLDDFKQTLELAGEASTLSPTVNVQLHLLSPLPMSPIYREFEGELEEPEPDDRRWMLLPALLLDERAVSVRELVRDARDIYSGFYNLPTPARGDKRALLQQVMRALDRTVGRTVLDGRVGGLLEHDDPELERELMAGADDTCERIGVGLAMGFFRRIRRRPTSTSGAFEGSRGPGMVRERPDLVGVP